MKIVDGVETFVGDEAGFPLIIKQTNNGKAVDLVAWVKRNRGFVDSSILDYGALIFRGFDVETVAAFEAVATACTSENWVDYIEATSPRSQVQSKTSTSTDYDSKYKIFPHNEKSYSADWPRYVFFYCKNPPTAQGSTPLVDCRRVYMAIPEAIRSRFKRDKLMYVRQFSNYMGIPWQKAFNVESKEEMEAYCQANFIDKIEWKDDGTPKITYTRNAAIKHPVTGDPCWFNHGVFFNVHAMEPALKEIFLSAFEEDELPYNTYYGTGTKIEKETVASLSKIYYDNAVSIPYEKNDIIFMDNILIAHGREPFEGDRKIYVTMTEQMKLEEAEYC
ncbi:TauD/TfdA family dioxygenase [Teredinibacter turnerae]|uniref:TauD/TfdA family dioxygenase n=1 Tax=Teredinibacter turnerae TaxID=2426 RepID=UPI00037E1E97|nr:TauD/TfdA family dioxygenase [Teredinibacter turnerae]